MISVIWMSDSVIVGRISAFSPLLVRGRWSTSRSATVSPRPNDGSQPSCTANTRISRMPIRNVGRLTPTSEAASSTCDSQLLRRNAVYTPSGMPTKSASSAADVASSMVAGSRSLMQRRHLARLAQRQAELAVHRVADEAGELHVERLVEAELAAQPRAVLDGGVLPDHELHGIAGEIEEAEGDERHDQHHEGGLQQPAEDEGEQGGGKSYKRLPPPQPPREDLRTCESLARCGSRAGCGGPTP